MLQFPICPCVFFFIFSLCSPPHLTFSEFFFLFLPQFRWLADFVFSPMIPGKGEGVSIYSYIFYSPYDHIPGVCFSFFIFIA